MEQTESGEKFNMDVVTYTLAKDYTNKQIAEIETKGLDARLEFSFTKNTGSLTLQMISNTTSQVIATAVISLPTTDIPESASYDTSNNHLVFTKVDGTTFYADLTALVNSKQDTLPSGQNNTFLHINALTGEIEWKDIEFSSDPYFEDIQGNPRDNFNLLTEFNKYALDEDVQVISGDVTTLQGDLTTVEGNLTTLSNTVSSLSTTVAGKEDSSNKVTRWQATTDDTHYPSEKLVKDSLDAKQNTLVSGATIKTINNESLLGSGNITIQGGASGPQVEIFTATLNNDFSIASLGSETTYANVQASINNNNYPILKLTKPSNGRNVTFFAPFYVESYNPGVNPADQYYEFNTFLRVPDFAVLHFFLAHPDNVNTPTHTALFVTLTHDEYAKLKLLTEAMTFSNSNADLDINLNIKANSIDVD